MKKPGDLDVVHTDVLGDGAVGTTEISEAELARIEEALTRPLGPANEATMRAAYQAVPGFRKTILELVAEIRRLRQASGGR